MAHDVFISYSSKDKPIADAICANLEGAGIRCWIAPRDIAPGEDWPTAINKAITKSRVMVLIFSSNSNSSEDVSRELNLAANSKLIIIPFKIDNIEPEPGKQYYLARTHWLDAMNPPTRKQISLLVQTVKKLLAPESSVAAPVTPVPLPTAQKVTRQPKAKIFKPWMLWIAIPSCILLLLALCIGVVFLGRKYLAARPASPTPIWTALAPMPTSPNALPLTQSPTPVAGVTITSAPTLIPAVSVNIHATAGTILDVPGSYVAWSPDGKWLVIGERQIHFYNPQSLQEVRSFQADRWVTGMTISPDSKILAAIDETRGVMLFDMATGSELLTLPRTTISTSAASSSYLAFTPDGLTLAVVLGDTVKLFNVTNGQETGTLVAKGANSILFSRDGKSLYAGGWEGILVLDVSTGSIIRTMGDMTNEGSRLALSPDGTLLVSAGSFDQPMVLWEASTGRQLRTFTGHTGGVNSLAFSPDGKLLASSAGDVTIKLWDVATGTTLQTLVGHTEAAASLAFSPDGATLVSGSQDGTTRLWSLSAGGSEPTATSTPATSTSSRPTALPLSSRAVLVDNAAQVKNQRVLDVEGSMITWSPDGKWLVIGGNQVHIYDTQSMSQVRDIQVKYDVGGLAVSPDSKVLAVIDISNAVKLFDMATGSELQTLPRTDISTSAASNSFMAFTPNSLTLAVVIGDTVKLFNVTSGQETGTILAKGAFAIAISPDGRYLYSGGWGSQITVWDVATGTQTITFGDKARGVNRMILSPDGSLLVSAGVSNEPMILWEAATGRQLRTFAGHTDSVTAMAFSPDGKLLASSARDVTIKLWNVATATTLQTLVGHTEAATGLAFSPDGATLASTAYDQGIWLWGLPTK